MKLAQTQAALSAARAVHTSSRQMRQCLRVSQKEIGPRASSG